ncbi:TonB-dependent siderophore receptor [Gallaecimonas mangrovi]|uniref:TonB-dependent siderophore receptor n=1 Tax=Gallaecimonas mangrovi TaxID=2291597 RepID=UPI000E203C2B|nr:TonB-dependent receptor [Gallaecimonas mangrovi]
MKSFALLPLAVFAASYLQPVYADTQSQTATTGTSASQTKSDSSDVEHITVKGRALSLYRVDDGSTALKTPTPIERTPQTVQVLPEQLIEDQGATDISDLYRSISGVSQYNYSWVTFRGFRQDNVRYDGVQGDPYGDFSTPLLFNIQQVQVLKGPSGALYGAGDPGGLINYVTKKPSYTPNNKLTLKTGNDQFNSASIELSGPLTAGADQRYRLGFYQDHENPYRNNTDSRHRVFDGGYAIDLDEDTTLTLQLTNVKEHESGARMRGIPTDKDGNFLTSMRWNQNEKSDFEQLEATSYQARLDHDINSWLSTNVTLRYYHNQELQKYHEPTSMTDTNGDGVADYTERQFRDQNRKNNAGSVTANAVAQLDNHTLLVGAELFQQNQDFLYYRANTADGVVGISYDDPQYGVTDPNSYVMHLVTDTHSKAINYGLYVQDQWRITQAWDVTGSARFGGFDDKIDDHKADESDSYSDHWVSYRIGSTYKINDNLHPYLSWANGFVPQDVSDQLSSAGGPFDPEESQEAEVGLRTYWLDNRINLNLAAYHIVKKNILQTDPDDTDKYVALGKVRSQGLEMDLIGDLTENWVLNLNYAYNDTVVKDATDGISRSYDGKRFANSPRNQLGIWTRYDFKSIASAISFGSNYVSEQFSQDGYRVKAYNVFDAAWQTNWNTWLFQLNVKNLFDKKYAVSGFLGRIGEFPGEHRRVYATATYKF